MATDPFDGVGEFGQEIGAPTFVELIYTTLREGKAFSPSTATVENSIPRLAYGKPGPYRDVIPQTPPIVVPAAPLSVRKYTLAQPSVGGGYRAQRLAAEFRDMVSNRITPQENPTDGIPDDCETAITDLRTYIEWNGIVRQPVNIFNLVARLTYRNEDSPFNKTILNLFPLSDGRLSTVTPVACGGSTVADFWKQQGNGGFVQTVVTATEVNPATIDTIEEGDLNSLTRRVNWLWATPGSTTGTSQDALVTTWPIIPAGLLESIEFLVLINAANPPSEAGDTPPACGGPFAIGPDPAESLDLAIRYVNSRGQSREFVGTLEIADLFPVTANFTAAANTWDHQSAVKYGIKGTTARWESVKFVLDTVDGAGLDQCTAPLSFTTRGSGTWNLPSFSFGSAQGNATPPCEPSIVITKIQVGEGANEQQMIQLPFTASTDGGTWDITFERNGVSQTATVDAEVTAEELQETLESFTNIGAGNVLVSGGDDGLFSIDFQGTLGNLNLPLLEADGSNLIVYGSGLVRRVQRGGLTNQIQRYASLMNGTGLDIVLTYNGLESAVVNRESSVAEWQDAVDSLIGAGNTVVTKEIVQVGSRTWAYFTVEFVGIYLGVAVTPAVPNGLTFTGFRPVSAFVDVGWGTFTIIRGGLLVNEQQTVELDERISRYQLQFTNPTTAVKVRTSDLLPTDSAATIKAAILAVCSWFDNDSIIVTSVTGDGLVTVTLDYEGTWARTAMPLVEFLAGNSNGGDIQVTELTAGFGKPTRQRVDIVNAKGGKYKLVVTIDGVTRKTTYLQCVAPIQTVANAINAISLFATQPATVNDATSPDPNVTLSYVVNFHRSLGDVALMTSEIDLLTCGSLGLRYVPGPPYDYVLEECVDDDSPFCSSGPLLCRPPSGGVEIAADDCCDQLTIRDSANRYREIMLQRDLFDPNTLVGSGKAMTVRDMAVVKGLKPALYAAYNRDFTTGKLTAVAMDAAVENRMSVLLVEKSIDSDATRKRLAQRLRTTPNILPSRSVW